MRLFPQGEPMIDHTEPDALTPEQEAEQERQAAQAFDDIAQQLALFPELEAQKKQGNAKGKSSVS
jgi:hypothetical protein